MRTLYVVPIIHTAADLGTLAASIERTASNLLGEAFWLAHKEIVAGFWNAIASFFESLDVAGFKVYQDGLIADGEMGMRIVEQGAKDGSKNYELIARMMEKGAELVRTEDLDLVKREYELICQVVKAKSAAESVAASARFKLAAGQLLKSRDGFMAQRIGHTLGVSQTGVLFIGAYHDIVPRLPPDFAVKEVKETHKVRQYHALLTDFRHSQVRLEQLGEYLVAPVVMD